MTPPENIPEVPNGSGMPAVPAPIMASPSVPEHAAISASQARPDAMERKALEDERARFVSLAENNDAFLGMCTLQGVPFYVNPAGRRLIGLESFDQARRTPVEEFFFPEDQDFILNDFFPRVLRDGQGEVEIRLRHFETGAPIWVLYHVFTMSDDAGRPLGLATISRDIRERKAFEAVREHLAQRERNISTYLQAALMPAIPERVPGMALAKYYEAALDEAGVGGDFYDVFPVTKDRTALIVGDLSGKGLAAATQVATVRNMLRYALHQARTQAKAVERLNAFLIEQRLLTGFATLFVGTYESATRTLTYVNCGQEPALIRRVAGDVEGLAPTGPVLGAFEGAKFGERKVTLRLGDALVIFTDGLTEVGQSRQELLNIEGVVSLLGEIAIPKELDTAQPVAEHVALRLIVGVDAAAQFGVMRDDVCLLVGVVE